MKSGTRMALAVGAGYVLGRRRKMRLAMIVGGAALAGAGGVGGRLVRRGIKAASSADLLGKVPPELAEIGGIIRNDLVSAGKDAARTAVNSRMDSLSDSLRDRADAWRNPAETARQITGGGEEPDEDEYEDDHEDAGNGRRPSGRARQRANGGGRRRRTSELDEDEYGLEPDEDEPDEDELDEDEAPARPVRRTRR